jgi:endonuclease/exonuclease/phosphatase family metal-dependent hydrolase
MINYRKIMMNTSKAKLLLLIFCLFSFCAAYCQTTTTLKIGTYNVGHFNCGKLGGYQGKDTQAQLKKWKKWIKKQKLDIMSVNEWNYYFDKDSTIDATAKLLKPVYKNISFGPLHKWIYNGIATDFKIENVRIMQSPHKDYYAVIGDVKIGNHVVTVISTHIPWQKEFHAKGLEELIVEMKKYKYLICMGDMNALDEEQQNFAKEGFNVANGGEKGFFRTVDELKKSKNISIDNIITSKNIKILDIDATKTGLSNNDHNPLEARIEIDW